MHVAAVGFVFARFQETNLTLVVWCICLCVLLRPYRHMHSFNSLPVFPSQMTVLKKELHVNSYRLSAFFISQTTVALLPMLVWSLYFSSLVYALSLGPTSIGIWHFFVLYGAILLNLITMQSIGLAISAGVPEKHMVTVSITLITFFFGYSGLFVPWEAMVGWLQWTRHVNLMVYCYQLVLYIIFGLGAHKFKCLETTSSFDVCKKIRESSDFTR